MGHGGRPQEVKDVGYERAIVYGIVRQIHGDKLQRCICPTADGSQDGKQSEDTDAVVPETQSKNTQREDAASCRRRRGQHVLDADVAQKVETQVHVQRSQRQKEQPITEREGGRPFLRSLSA